MERREIAWAVFVSDKTRFSASAGIVPAVSSTPAARLFLDFIHGLPFLVVDDASLPEAPCVPWSNVASFGWAPDAAVAKAKK